MKLDIQCIRDILITLEQQQTFVHMSPECFAALLPQYSSDQIYYTCLRLHEGEYLNLDFFNGVIKEINDLTFFGHELLADIMPKNNWEKISGALMQGGTASVKAIANVAIDLGTEALKSKLGLNAH